MIFFYTGLASWFEIGVMNFYLFEELILLDDLCVLCETRVRGPPRWWAI